MSCWHVILFCVIIVITDDRRDFHKWIYFTLRFLGSTYVSLLNLQYSMNDLSAYLIPIVYRIASGAFACRWGCRAK